MQSKEIFEFSIYEIYLFFLPEIIQHKKTAKNKFINLNSEIDSKAIIGVLKIHQKTNCKRNTDPIK